MGLDFRDRFRIVLLCRSLMLVKSLIRLECEFDIDKDSRQPNSAAGSSIDKQVRASSVLQTSYKGMFTNFEPELLNAPDSLTFRTGLNL